jgi:pyruvate/2-oxoglutarate dehydrogenase complex dihydrolipoamide dehydrogenase (E3) component
VEVRGEDGTVQRLSTRSLVIAAVNALCGGFKRFKVDYRVIPWVTFTSPEDR